ncbi:MAG TPA: hypothetical protein VGE13_00835 [Candidatus Saccharimonadales bacterium]
MRQLSKHRLHERGAAHFIALILFVALVGVVGFVGYNAWQKQTSNAGNKATLGSLQTRLKNTEAALVKAKKLEASKLEKFNNKRKNEKKEDPEIAKLYTQLNKATKAASDLPSLDTVNQRVANRTADKDAAYAQYVAAQQEVERIKATKKQIGLADARNKRDNKKTKWQEAETDLTKASDKKTEVLRAQEAINTAKAQIDARRQSWGQWTALQNARAKVAELEKKIASLKAQIAEAKKNSVKDTGKKSTPKPASTPAPKCSSGYVCTKSGQRLPQFTSWEWIKPYSDKVCNLERATRIANTPDGAVYRYDYMCQKQRRAYSYDSSKATGVAYKTQYNYFRISSEKKLWNHN